MSQIERGQLIVTSEITDEHLGMLSGSQLEELGENRFRVRVFLSVWDKNSRTNSSEKQGPGKVILAAVFGKPDSAGGLYVFNPAGNAIQDMEPEEIEEEIKEEGCLYQIGRWMSGNKVADHLFEEDPSQTEDYTFRFEKIQPVFNKFEQPKNPGFQLSEASLQVGNVEFEADVLVL